MNAKLIGILLLIAGGVGFLFLGGVGWYFLWGRHPHVVLSKPLPEKSGEPVCAVVAPDRVLVVAGKSATLLDLRTGKEKWSLDLTGSFAQASLPAAVPTPAAKEQQMSRMQAWYADLARRRGQLKSPEETEAFNLEAAQYQAALAALRGSPAPSPGKTAASLKPSTPPAAKPKGTPDAFAMPAPKESAEAELLRTRREREKERVRLWGEKLEAMKATAKTRLQLEALKEETARYQIALSAVQKAEARAAKSAAPASTPAGSPPPGTVATTTAPISKEPPAPPPDPFAQPAKIASFGAMLWVVRGQEAVGIERDKGRVAKKVALPGSMRRVWTGATNLFVLTEAAGVRQLLRINGADGAAIVLGISTQAREETRAGDAAGLDAEPYSSDFVVDGDALLELDSTMIEKKIMVRPALKHTSTEDWAKVDKETHSGWGADALKVAQALQNDAQREKTGGVERVDESLYEATVLRPLDGGKTVWSGKVTGRPRLYALSTVDLLIAGLRAVAIDRSGKPLWEAKLAYTTPRDGHDWERPGAEAPPPCREIGQAVYIYDRAALTAYQRDTGKVLWRLPSVGIHKLLAEPDGALYVCTENAPADSAPFGQEPQGAGGESCTILKVNGKTGAIIWSAPKYEDCFISAGAVYAVREPRDLSSIAGQGLGGTRSTPRFFLCKLNRYTGGSEWDWLQPRRPLQIMPEGRKVSLLFDHELQSLSSLAL